jgi:hypothetical protein
MAVSRRPFGDLKSGVQSEFEKWFPRGGWGDGIWSVRFTEEEYNLQISCPERDQPNGGVVVSFTQPFENAYQEQLRVTEEAERKNGFLLVSVLQSVARGRFFKLMGRGEVDFSVYIPTQRSYFVETQKGYRILAADADPITAQFADVFASGLKESKANSRIPRYLKGKIISRQNDWMFSFDDDRFLALSELSSGSKETLPILTTLDYYEESRNQRDHLLEVELYGEKKLYSYDDFTIEEPESSVFPQTQYQLVQEFAALANTVDFIPHFTITTHSPYILSAFDNLIKAGVVGGSSEEHRAAVEKVIEEKYWIKPEDFRAYKIADGKLESIYNEKTGELDADYLDNVSGEIAEEFSNLLEIQYGK